MSYTINAWLDNGDPRLEIIDTRTGRICLSWRYQEGGRHQGRSDRGEITRLFRELILLTCQQQSSNLRVFAARELRQIAQPKPSGHHSKPEPFLNVARRLFSPPAESSPLPRLQTRSHPA